MCVDCRYITAIFDALRVHISPWCIRPIQSRILVKVSLLKMARCEEFDLGHGLKPTHRFQGENINTSSNYQTQASIIFCEKYRIADCRQAYALSNKYSHTW